MKFLHGLRVLWLTVGILLLDQASKLLVRGISLPTMGVDVDGMQYAQSISVIGKWLRITFVENPNMAFGFNFGGKLFLSVVAIIASIGIVAYLVRHRESPIALRLGLALVLAGALGNLIDRAFYGILFGYGTLFHGNVVDFIDVDLFTIRLGTGSFKFWPIFNVADSAVTCGVILLMIANLLQFPSKVSSTTAGDTSATPESPDAGEGTGA